MAHAKTHKCFAKECQRDIPNSKLLCIDHWKIVPEALRDRLCEQWKYGLAWRCHPTPEYTQAAVDIRAVIESKEARRRAAAVANSPLLTGGAA